MVTRTVERSYLVIAGLAFVGMWTSVALFLRGPDGTVLNFFRALVANWAVTMLTIEMLAMAAASALLIYRDCRRLHIGPVVLILLLAATAGFGVVVPLFLAVRERRLTQG